MNNKIIELLNIFKNSAQRLNELPPPQKRNLFIRNSFINTFASASRIVLYSRVFRDSFEPALCSARPSASTLPWRFSGTSAAWELGTCDPLIPWERLNGLFNAHLQQPQPETFLQPGKRVKRCRYRTPVSVRSIDSPDIIERSFTDRRQHPLPSFRSLPRFLSFHRKRSSVRRLRCSLLLGRC